MILRGLVVYQPWAWAIMNGKDVENRGRPLSHRGPLVIVAGAKKDWGYLHDAIGYMLEHCGLPASKHPQVSSLEFGGIIGCVEMYDVATPEQWPVTKWHMPGQYGYRIRKAVPLPFRALKGHQGLMRIEMTPREVSAIRKGGIALENP